MDTIDEPMYPSDLNTTEPYAENMTYLYATNAPFPNTTTSTSLSLTNQTRTIGCFPPRNNSVQMDEVDPVGCWTAFRTGSYLPRLDDIFSLGAGSSYQYSLTLPSELQVTYAEQVCHNLLNRSTDVVGAQSDVPQSPNPDGLSSSPYGSSCQWMDSLPNCSPDFGIVCELSGESPPTCRLNIRMQAAFILAGCLIIKAIYMVMVNWTARNRVKAHCLTFGDVIVSSAMASGIRVHHECMVSAGDGHRHETSHKCHKHCSSKEESDNGDTIGHCQKCRKFNDVDQAADLPHPSIAIKFKKSLLANLGIPALTQMITMVLCAICTLAISGYLAFTWASVSSYYKRVCTECGASTDGSCGGDCKYPLFDFLQQQIGTWGGFNSSGVIGLLPSNQLASEQAAFWISNGLQLVYSFLYILLIYNITLISMERDWAKFETGRHRLRCTIVRGPHFEESYLLQLPKRIIFPLMAFSSLMHWMLSQAVSTREKVWSNTKAGVEVSQYEVCMARPIQREYALTCSCQITYGSYPVWITTILLLAMCASCWWAFAYRREGFIPQMYGSIRACCSATAQLDDFPKEGVQWGDREWFFSLFRRMLMFGHAVGDNGRFRQAGFSARHVENIVPGEIYC